MKISFSFKQPKALGDAQHEVSQAILRLLEGKQDFDVVFTVREQGKTSDQIRGLHKLLDLLIPRVSDLYGYKFNRDGIKELLKPQFGFMRGVSEVEAIHFAIKQKASLGNKMTKKEFSELVESIKEHERVPKSFAKATKQELMEFITKVEALGEKMGWDEIKLKKNTLET